MCKKQTAVSHRSTESEITSLHAALRMVGKCHVQPATMSNVTKTQKVKRRKKVDQLSDVDYVPTNTILLTMNLSCTSLKINEAVITI